jgi:dihydrolipoamide dehydrogenase
LRQVATGHDSGFNIGSDRIWNSTAALELRHVPKSLLVVGGGYIGLELGTVYNALGSKSRLSK